MEPAIKIEADPYRGASVVLYDGVCAMCNGVVRFVFRRDHARRFFFAALQDPFARDAFSRHGQNADDLDTFAVVLDHALPTERVLVQSIALLHILEEMGGVWKMLAALLGVFPTRALDRGYAVIVRNRYRIFGRYETCPLPSPEERARFIRQSTPTE